MTCEQIQNDIALWVGNDATPQEAEQVRQHLATCPDCRAHAQRLKTAMAMVGRSTPEPTYDTTDSLWPAIARRLPQRPRKTADASWRKWLPSVAATVVAAGVMVAVVVLPPKNNVDPLGNPVPRGMGVGSAIESLQEQTKPDAEKKKQQNPITRPAYAKPE
jgi:anti-sigma factor RsiW